MRVGVIQDTSILAWSQLVSDTGRTLFSLPSCGVELFSTSHSASRLKAEFSCYTVFTKAEEEKENIQFFTFVCYESYPTFLSSFSSLFLWLFHKNTTNWILIFPYSYRHPLRTHSPASSTSGPQSFLRPTAHDSHHRECDPLRSRAKTGRMEGGMSHIPHIDFLALITFPWWPAESWAWRVSQKTEIMKTKTGLQ